MYSNNLESVAPISLQDASINSNQMQVKHTSNSRMDRQGRVLLPFWTNKQARKQLKYIAIEEEITQQRLMAEALNMLFRTRGKPPIA